MADIESFGRALRDLRTKAGMTQAAVAYSANVSQATVSGWETGKKWPDGHLGTLARLYGVTQDELLDLRIGLTTPVERAIAADEGLTQKEQDTLLAAYGAMTGRPSVSHVQDLYRSGIFSRLPKL